MCTIKENHFNIIAYYQLSHYQLNLDNQYSNICY